MTLVDSKSAWHFVLIQLTPADHTTGDYDRLPRAYMYKIEFLISDFFLNTIYGIVNMIPLAFV